MRRTLASLAILFALLFALSPAHAQSAPPCCLITIDDLLNGPPVVTFSGVTFSFAIDNEFALIDLTGAPAFANAAVFFTEPSSPAISDVLVLVTVNSPGDPLDGKEILAFASDGASQFGFVSGLAQVVPNVTIPETGDFQDVSLALGLPSAGLVAVRSGEEAVTAPEPSSLMLLGSSLFGLAGFASRKLKG